MSRLPRVYMAGKISKYDWRHDLTPSYALRNVDLRYDEATQSVRPVETFAVSGFEYVGPFFLADDHGCFHGPHSHGFGALHWPECGPGNVDDYALDRALDPEDRHAGYWRTRSLVHRSCLAQIRSSDAIFAWVEQWDAYATLLEIGYATARGIPVYLAFDLMYQPKPIQDAPSSVWNDWWFAEQTASFCEYAPDARTAWMAFIQWWESRGPWSPPERKRRLWFVQEAP